MPDRHSLYTTPATTHTHYVLGPPLQTTVPSCLFNLQGNSRFISLRVTKLHPSITSGARLALSFAHAVLIGLP